MWISRLHYELIRDKAKEFREWHESRVTSLTNDFEDRLAERDSIIASQEIRIRALDDERKDLIDRLLMREEKRLEPVKQVAEVQDELPQWMIPIRDQIDEGADAKS